uniref:Uncharacterized protein n=1 Tax=Anopheles atroparvus TaxID=41427 RepID=A0A182IJC3_ANOAO
MSPLPGIKCGVRLMVCARAIGGPRSDSPARQSSVVKTSLTPPGVASAAAVRASLKKNISLGYFGEIVPRGGARDRRLLDGGVDGLRRKRYRGQRDGITDRADDRTGARDDGRFRARDGRKLDGGVDGLCRKGDRRQRYGAVVLHRLDDGRGSGVDGGLGARDRRKLYGRVDELRWQRYRWLRNGASVRNGLIDGSGGHDGARPVVGLGRSQEEVSREWNIIRLQRENAHRSAKW